MAAAAVHCPAAQPGSGFKFKVREKTGKYVQIGLNHKDHKDQVTCTVTPRQPSHGTVLWLPPALN